jgi:hypothetical protein
MTQMNIESSGPQKSPAAAKPEPPVEPNESELAKRSTAAAQVRLLQLWAQVTVDAIRNKEMSQTAGGFQSQTD